MKNYSLQKIEGKLLQNVDQNFSLTSKLLGRSMYNSIILYDRKKYNKILKIERRLIIFILNNFWYFLPRIKAKAKNGTFKEHKIDCNLLNIFRINNSEYEFPRAFYSQQSKHNGYTLDEYDRKVKAEESNYIWCSPPIEDEFYQKVMNNVNSKIAGIVLANFANSSVSKLMGFEINYI